MSKEVLIMSTGMSEKFNILERSPHDDCHQVEEAPSRGEVETLHWTASRFNVQVTTEDGQLVLWNTLSSSISVFPSSQREKVKALLTRRITEGKAEGWIGY